MPKHTRFVLGQQVRSNADGLYNRSMPDVGNSAIDTT